MPPNEKLAELFRQLQGSPPPPPDIPLTKLEKRVAARAPARKDRLTNRRSWQMRGRTRGVWYEDLVNILPGYPATPEIMAKRSAQCREQVIRLNAIPGKMHRKGVPDGWAGNRKGLTELREQAKAEAKEIVAIMAVQGMITPNEDPRAEEALEFAIGVVRAVRPDGVGAHTVEARLKASKLVLEYTKAKPAAKIEATVGKAEDFLALLAARKAAGV